jgi:predicted dehydrogenase
MELDGFNRIKAGMVGGGDGAGIAEVHRAAMRLEGSYDLVAGVFSRNMDRSRQAGINLGIAENRIYSSFKEMALSEAALPDGIDVVVIVTPNDSHYSIASTFVQVGIHVICEKPLTTTMDDAFQLYRSVVDRKVVFGLTHNYSGYTMVRHAAALVREGALGRIRIVQAEHAQGAGALPFVRLEDQSLPWRSDPTVAGKAIVVSDIGTHAHHLARYITGLEVTAVAAELSTHVPGRRVYDNAQISMRLSNGACGALWASRVATGNAHGLRIRVYGEKAGLEWHHEDPEHLLLQPVQEPPQILAKGQPGLSSAAKATGRLKLGHPEGFIESFAALYADFARAIRGRRDGTTVQQPEPGFPTIEDGLCGVKFVEAVVQSHKNNGAWTDASISSGFIKK